MLNVHDNLIIGYTVDFKEKKIIMNTEYWDGDYHEETTLTFNGVIAHNFKEVGESLSVIFDIEEFPIEDFITDELNLLNTFKNYAWPFSYSDLEDLKK